MAITVFKSKVGLEDYGDAISGAHLITTDNGSLTTDIRNFSICLRFNYLVLGDKAEGKGRLVTISKWRTTEKVTFIILTCTYFVDTTVLLI